MGKWTIHITSTSIQEFSVINISESDDEDEDDGDNDDGDDDDGDDDDGDDDDSDDDDGDDDDGDAGNDNAGNDNDVMQDIQYKLVQIDPLTGIANSIGTLSRTYDSLSFDTENSNDEVLAFTATSESAFYKITVNIETNATSEILVSTTNTNLLSGQAWCGDKYIALFDHARSKLVFSSQNDFTDTIGWINLGWHHFGTVLFVKENEDSGSLAISYD